MLTGNTPRKPAMDPKHGLITTDTLLISGGVSGGYVKRNHIERMFGKLKQPRRIDTRYGKTTLSLASSLNLAAARLWLKSFVNAA
jgi:hypothetical protein